MKNRRHRRLEKKRRARQGLARARLMLARDLGWLPGYPLDAGAGVWMSMPWETPGQAARHRIDGDVLRRAEVTLVQLRRHFPISLPQLVEEVDDWSARMEWLLAAIKRHVYAGAPWDAVEAVKQGPLPARWRRRYFGLRAAHRRLEPLIDAAAFLELSVRRRPSEAVLSWIEEEEVALERLLENGAEVGEALQLGALRQDVGARCVGQLAELLGDRRFSETPENLWATLAGLAAAGEEALQGKRYETPAESPSQETMGGSWRRVVGALLASKSALRRSAERLIEAALPPDLPELCVDVRERAMWLREMLAIRWEGSNRGPFVKPERLIDDIHAANATLAPLATLPGALCAALSATGVDVHGVIVVLNAMSELATALGEVDRGLALQLIGRYDRLGYLTAPSSRVKSAVSSVAGLVRRRGVCPTLVDHWREALRVGYKDDLVEDLVDAATHSQTARRVVALLEQLAYDEGMALSDAALISLSSVVEAATGLVRGGKKIPYYNPLPLARMVLPKCKNAIFSPSWRAALALGSGDATDAELLAAAEDADVAAALRTVGAAPLDEALRRGAQEAALTRQFARLRELGDALDWLDRLDGDLPVVETGNLSARDWIARHPPELHAVLEELAASSPDAEAIAARALAHIAPDRSRIEDELKFLEGRLTDAKSDTAAPTEEETIRRIEQRRQTLRSRLAAPVSLRISQLAKAAGKLQRRADAMRWESFQVACQLAIAAKLERLVAWEGDISPLLRPPWNRVLRGILELPRGDRALGFWVLSRRLADPDDDFRSEPANIGFLDRLERIGVRTGPWLDRERSRVWIATEGRSYRLAFTRDALDVLMMGEHFSTCLAADGCNFFATLANAVDVNKQVLYGRTEKGGVVGRCLMALTDAGRLLTYHPYAHDTNDEFAAAAGEFASQLAAEMGTFVDPRGTASTLVAKHWYDDGTVALGTGPGVSDATDSWRSVLAKAALATLPAELQAALGSAHAVADWWLEYMWDEAVEDRKEAIGPLVAWLGAESGVARADRLRMAVRTYAAGNRDQALELLAGIGAERAVGIVERAFCRNCAGWHGVGNQQALWELLSAWNPSIALRLLRRTRPWGVRNDGSEQGLRRGVLVNLLRRLGRHTSAAALESGPH